MTGFSFAGVVVGLGGMYLGLSDAVMAIAFVCAGLMYFWVIMRAWQVMEFLRRSICRRGEGSPDTDLEYSDRRQSIGRYYSGKERRCDHDRRKVNASYSPKHK